MEVPLALLLLDHPGLKQEKEIKAEIQIIFRGFCPSTVISQGLSRLHIERSEQSLLERWSGRVSILIWDLSVATEVRSGCRYNANAAAVSRNGRDECVAHKSHA